MSRILDSALDTQRRDECAEADRALSVWQREWAARIAAGCSLEPVTPIRAKGNHLVAAQDEPEPGAPATWPQAEDFDPVDAIRRAGW